MPYKHKSSVARSRLAGLMLYCVSFLVAQTNVPPPESPTQPPAAQWQYGGFIDLGYLYDFNHPPNDIFRSRGTTWHLDDLHVNMAGAYIKKRVSEQSRWGAELTVQGGKDSEVFGFSATAPNLSGY